MPGTVDSRPLPRVLVVDDDDAFRESVVDMLSREGYRLQAVASAEEALELSAQGQVDLVLTDQRMPGMDGLELVRRLRASATPPAILLMTAYGTIPQAVEAVRSGACDYLTKPLESPQVLRAAIRRALGASRPLAPEAAGFDGFLTRDPATLEVLALADRAAATDATVLILGESGTGKELLAQRLHRRSPRAAGPFIAVNAAALPEALAESELFGHEKGAFTGAAGRHRGRFELAHGGTLFLDEIGELSEAVQAKLLRALEQRSIERVGSERSIDIDLRLIAATHRDLARDVAEGRFRADLYYRLNVVALRLPPLRERPGDIPLLAEHFLERLATALSLPVRPLAPSAVLQLQSHGWPGNVRELRNALERASIAAVGDVIEAADLPALAPGVVEESSEAPLALQERERRAILDALDRTSGHRERAAELLGISVRTLYNRLRQYGIR